MFCIKVLRLENKYVSVLRSRMKKIRLVLEEGLTGMGKVGTSFIGWRVA